MVEKSGECFMNFASFEWCISRFSEKEKNEEEKVACYLRVSQNRPVELGFCSVNAIKSWFWVELTSSQVESPSCSTLPVVIFLFSSHSLCCKYAALALSSSPLKCLWNAVNSHRVLFRSEIADALKVVFSNHNATLIFTPVVPFRSKEQCRTLMCYSCSFPFYLLQVFSANVRLILNSESFQEVQDSLSHRKCSLLRGKKNNLLHCNPTFVFT